MMKQEKKQTYEVDLLVALFITKEIKADSEDEAIQIAQGSVKTGDVIDAFQSGDCEIEDQGASRVMQEDDEDNE